MIYLYVLSQDLTLLSFDHRSQEEAKPGSEQSYWKIVSSDHWLFLQGQVSAYGGCYNNEWSSGREIIGSVYRYKSPSSSHIHTRTSHSRCNDNPW